MEDDAAALGVDGVDGLAGREAAAELDHALGETDLAEALVTLVVREGIGGAGALGAVATALGTGASLRVDRGIVDDLVVDGVVCGAQAGVIDGEEAELSGHNGRWWRARHASREARRYGAPAKVRPGQLRRMGALPSGRELWPQKRWVGVFAPCHVNLIFRY